MTCRGLSEVTNTEVVVSLLQLFILKEGRLVFDRHSLFPSSNLFGLLHYPLGLRYKIVEIIVSKRVCV